MSLNCNRGAIHELCDATIQYNCKSYADAEITKKSENAKNELFITL